MGKGQRATQAYKSTEYISQQRDSDGLITHPFTAAPTTSSSLLGATPSSKSSTTTVLSAANQALSQAAASSKPASLPVPEAKPARSESPELETVPTFTLVTTYLSYLMLIVFAHIRDFFGKIFYPSEYVQLREQNGFAPMVSDFESLWSRRLYGRIRDCFNRPITGVAGGHVDLIERFSRDFNRTFEFTGRVKNVLNLASYNYLGFAQSEGPCADTVEKTMREHGLTQGSSRAEAGRTRLLVETEDTVARFVGAEAALIVSMGYATNALNIPAMV
ncbi:serine palmitoyltransferase component, partial [Linderina macrospora]